MILGAHQLHYLPWLRYFHKIASCDVFVVLDNIQFNKNGWQNRNKIKTSQGPLILTVPVLQKFQQNLLDVEIDQKQGWGKKHERTLQIHYQKAPYFRDHESFLREVFERPWQRLNDLNNELLFYFLKVLGIKTKIIRSSEISLKGEATERLTGICKELGARAYVTGAYATQVYLDADIFKREGIELITQEFECPQYPQVYPESGFIPELSIVDLVFNCGSKSLEVLMQGTPDKISGQSR